MTAHSLASMSNKRPLTDEELAMAATVKAAIAATPGMTEERLGELAGVSQGAVSHWTGGRLPIPAGRAGRVADALGINDPGSISIAYREIVGGRHSQSVRLDPDIVRAVARAVQDVAEELDLNPGIRETVEISAELYDRARNSVIATADVVWLTKRLEQGAARNAGGGDIPDGSGDAPGEVGGGNTKAQAVRRRRK